MKKKPAMATAATYAGSLKEFFDMVEKDYQISKIAHDKISKHVDTIVDAEVEKLEKIIDDYPIVKKKLNKAITALEQILGYHFYGTHSNRFRDILKELKDEK